MVVAADGGEKDRPALKPPHQQINTRCSNPKERHDQQVELVEIIVVARIEDVVVVVDHTAAPT